MYAGSAFRAPRRNDKKEWAMLEVLIRDGVKFHYYGGYGIMPSNKNEAKKQRSRRKKQPVLARRTSSGKRVLLKRVPINMEDWRAWTMNWGNNLYIVEQ